MTENEATAPREFYSRTVEEDLEERRFGGACIPLPAERTVPAHRHARRWRSIRPSPRITAQVQPALRRHPTGQEETICKAIIEDIRCRSRLSATRFLRLGLLGKRMNGRATVRQDSLCRRPDAGEIPTSRTLTEPARTALSRPLRRRELDLLRRMRAGSSPRLARTARQDRYGVA